MESSPSAETKGSGSAVASIGRPEVGINVGYDVTPRLRVFGGYSFLYWSDVARPGRQIDRTLDENRIPDFPAAPAANGVRPAASVTSESIWIQGFNFGILYKW